MIQTLGGSKEEGKKIFEQIDFYRREHNNYELFTPFEQRQKHEIAPIIPEYSAHERNFLQWEGNSHV